MKVFDKNGRELELSVYGKHDDDIQIDEIYYIDGDEEVTDDVIEYIYNRYSDAIYEEWYMSKCGEAEDYYEGMFE